MCAGSASSTGTAHQLWSDAAQVKTGSVDEDAVVHERQRESDRGRGDPAVAVVRLVGQRVSGLPATLAQVGAGGDRGIVGLSDHELRDPSFQAKASQLAPSGAKHAVAELRERLKSEEPGRRADQLAIPVGKTLGAFVQQPADDHRVDDDARHTGVSHASASAS